MAGMQGIFKKPTILTIVRIFNKNLKWHLKMRHYGALVLETPDRRNSDLISMRIFVLLVCLTASCSLVMLTEFDSSREVLDQVNNLELNAYLSEAQVQEFQHLESEQKTISAATAGLLELESQMKPEDTKVS